MAQVVVLADPPREGLVLPDVPESPAVSPADAATLYTAFLRDTVVAAEDSGQAVLVNVRPDDLLPEAHRRDVDPESAMRATVEEALAAPGEVRFEPQVGSSRSARVGNTVTHLLREEEKDGVIVVDPRAPFFERTGISELAMKLRGSDVVLAPSTRGRVAAMAFSDVVDFENVLAAPTLTRLTDRAVEAGLAVDYTAVQPLVETESDLVSLVSLVRSQATAGRDLPEFTAAAVDELDLRLATMDGRVAAVPGTDSS
jgi:2-phospho-L-lactate guanylyltransferase (CobY/MobA/RfbA family)